MQNSHRDFQTDEFRIVAKVVGFLAFLTGLLYLRVAVSEGMLAVQINGLPYGGPLTFGLFLLGCAGLIAALRWEVAGGVVAALSGLALFGMMFLMGRGWLDAFFYGSPFAIAGSLLVCCRLRKKGNR